MCSFSICVSIVTRITVHDFYKLKLYTFTLLYLKYANIAK